MQSRVKQEVPIGLLAYDGDKPIAWCSVAPRETFRSLGGNDTKEHVWSITCFFVQRQYRGQSVTSKLITAAIAYAKANGARHVEAYPVAPDSPTYRYMGLVPNFEKAGFQYVKTAGTRRHVMTLALD